MKLKKSPRKWAQKNKEIENKKEKIKKKKIQEMQYPNNVSYKKKPEKKKTKGKKFPELKTRVGKLNAPTTYTTKWVKTDQHQSISP